MTAVSAPQTHRQTHREAKVKEETKQFLESRGHGNLPNFRQKSFVVFPEIRVWWVNCRDCGRGSRITLRTNSEDETGGPVVRRQWIDGEGNEIFGEMGCWKFRAPAFPVPRMRSLFSAIGRIMDLRRNT